MCPVGIFVNNCISFVCPGFFKMNYSFYKLYQCLNYTTSFILLPLANKVCEGYVFTRVCLSMGVVVSQHGLQVSKPTLKGKLRGLGGGVSRPTPRAKLRVWLGFLQAHTQGGKLRGLARRGVYSPGGVSQHALRQTPPADGYCCGWYASYWNASLF